MLLQIKTRTKTVNIRIQTTFSSFDKELMYSVIILKIKENIIFC